MPMPAEYQRATDHLSAFLADVRDEAGLGSTHQAYTTSQAVLYAFRARLTLRDAIRFAGALPAGLRAIFVADWDPDAAVLPFADRNSMTEEVRSLRANHNFSPDTAIRDVARALRRHVDEAELDRLLKTLPSGSIGFWDPESESP